jgi:hypothetical protein
MSKNGLHRHYDRLMPEERFRLDVLAMARGDAEESERLTRTCPRRSYIMNDAGFGERWSGTRELGLRVYIALSSPLAKLRMIDAVRELAPFARTLMYNTAFDAYFDGHHSGSFHAWSYAGKKGTPPMWPEEGDPEEGNEDPAVLEDTEHIEWMVNLNSKFMPDLMERLEREVATEARSVWEGFSVFCREDMNLSPEKVLKVVVEPGLEHVEDMKARAERLGLEPDEEIATVIREGLAESWSVIIERGEV